MDDQDQKNSDISNEEQMGSSNDQFDKYNNEIYDGLKLYASKESLSSDEENLTNSNPPTYLDEDEPVCHHQNFFKKLLVLDEPFKTEED